MIENNIMPSGNVENPYIIKFKLVDINNKTIDCPDKFSYQFSNSNTTFTDYDCQNQTLYINNSFTIIDEYSFIIPMMNKTYSFYINHGEPIISNNSIIYFNCSKEVLQSQNASITLSLDVKDKYNNSIPIEEIIKNLNIKIYFMAIVLPMVFEKNENGLIKYSSLTGIMIGGIYNYRLVYNEINIDVPLYYRTIVTNLPNFQSTTFYCGSARVLNGSSFNCSSCNNRFRIKFKDLANFELPINSFTLEAYIYNNNNNCQNNLDFQYYEEGPEHSCNLNCSNLNNDSFLLVNLIGRNGSGIYSFGIY